MKKKFELQEQWNVILTWKLYSANCSGVMYGKRQQEMKVLHMYNIW
jgi:hypothetical protein